MSCTLAWSLILSASGSLKGTTCYGCATRAAKCFMHPAETGDVRPGWGKCLQLLSFTTGNILSCCWDLLLVQCQHQVFTKTCCLVVSYALSPLDIATCPKSHRIHSFSDLRVQLLAVLLFPLNRDLKVVILSKIHIRTRVKLLNMHKITKLLQIAGIVNELRKSWWRPLGGGEYFFARI